MVRVLVVSTKVKSFQGFLEFQRIPFYNAFDDIFQIANANSKGNGVGHGELLPSIWPAAPEVGPRTLPPPQSIPVASLSAPVLAVKSALHLQLHTHIQAYIVLPLVTYTQIRPRVDCGAVNIGPLLYTMQRRGGIGSGAGAGAVLGTALGQPVSGPSIQSILQRCCGIQRPASAFKNLKTAFPKTPPPKCQVFSRIHTMGSLS